MRTGAGCLYLLFVVLVVPAAAQPLQVSHERCESRINPLGVPLQQLSFSWQLQSRARGVVQTAYQLVIAGSKTKLQNNSFDVYNSGICRSRESVLVTCKNLPLQPGASYYWKVKTWDNLHHASSWSSIQRFTTCLQGDKGWAGARWIGYEDMSASMLVVPGVADTAGLGEKAVARTVIPLFRKQFVIARKPVRALAFVSGLGQYEICLNGTKAGAGFLSPGWTYYPKNCLYNVYDITALLNQGANVVALTVGNGFYNINRERYYKLNVAFGAPKMICKLQLEYNDGSRTTIVSDDSWKTAPSPIVFSSIYGGEDYDARLEKKGWNKAGFDDTHWRNARLVAPPGGVLEPEADHPVAVMDSIPVKTIQQLGDANYLYDFGQNASGIVSLQVRGHRGDTIRITPAELLDKNHLPNQQASGKPFYFTYVCKGEGPETWQPQFSYYGFRYAQVEGASPAGGHRKGAALLNLTLLHTRNSAPATGSFSCSDTLFNKINTLIQWAIKSNMQSVITDCPHREKLGWMEQNYLMGNSIQYNYDIHLLYRKLVVDMVNAQRPDGLVPDIAPEYVVFNDGFVDSPEWGSAAVIMPWLLYQWYGDTASMRTAYSMMLRYTDYLESKSVQHILSYGLGDWYDFGPGFPGYAQLTPVALTATAIYYYDVTLLARMAAVLGDTTQGNKLQERALAIKHAFNSKFFDEHRHVYATGSQTAMAMPLVTGLVDEQYKKAVLQNMIDSIYAHDKALTAGDIGFHFLVKALDDGGASQLLFEMNNRNDVAGYGFQLKKGATALTESWNALEEVSNNHLMLGHIMEWLYSGLAGIGQEENSTAYRHIRIRPQPVGSITSAKASFQSPYGLIVSDWRKEGSSFLLHVRIPVNTSAAVYLPAGAGSKIYEGNTVFPEARIIRSNGTSIVNIPSGEYRFRVE